MSTTARYVRNGAWAGVGFYLISAVVLLTLSMSYEHIQPRTSNRDIPVSLVERLGQALPTVIHG